MIKIIFGKPTVAKEVTTKYPNLAVVTVEAVKEAGKSRRVVFNELAGKELNLDNGNPQTIMFGYVTDIKEDGTEDKFVILSDVSGLENNPTDIVFKTSKNAVKYGNDDSEKGKAISNGNLIKHINAHIGECEEEREFVLVPFDAGQEAVDLGYDLFRLVSMIDYSNNLITLSEDAIEDAQEVVDELTDVIEEMNGEIANEPEVEVCPEPVTGNTGVTDMF